MARRIEPVILYSSGPQGQPVVGLPYTQKAEVPEPPKATGSSTPVAQALPQTSEPTPTQSIPSSESSATGEVESSSVSAAPSDSSAATTETSSGSSSASGEGKTSTTESNEVPSFEALVRSTDSSTSPRPTLPTPPRK